VNRQKSAVQIAGAKKAVLKAPAGKTTLSPALLAANQAHIIEAGLEPDVALHQRDRKRAHGAHTPPAVRLLDKPEICAVANLTYPTIWKMMRAGTFPRGRIVGGKSMWLSTEIDAWLAGLPVRALKGDVPSSEHPNQS
jgi:predicted DNA-binding transcriptional regulator AlpA